MGYYDQTDHILDGVVVAVATNIYILAKHSNGASKTWMFFRINQVNGNILDQVYVISEGTWDGLSSLDKISNTFYGE